MIGKPAMSIRSLKEQARAAKRAQRLQARIAKLRLRIGKLERILQRLRDKLAAYEKKANELEQEVVPRKLP